MKKVKIIDCISIFCYLLILWFVLSWLNIAAHNNTDQAYAAWNIITMLFEIVKERRYI